MMNINQRYFTWQERITINCLLRERPPPGLDQRLLFYSAVGLPANGFFIFNREGNEAGSYSLHEF